MYKASVITVSDKGYIGEREDLSGPLAAEMLKAAGYDVDDVKIVPDETDAIISALEACIKKGVNLVLTTGGTGFSKRDKTPEATQAVIKRDAPGIAEAIRLNSLKYTDRAMLSRGVAGISNDTLIINLPGSPKAVKESLEFILPAVHHGLDILLDTAKDCARKG